MFRFLRDKIFGNHNEREIKRLAPLVEQINQLEESTRQLRNEDFPVRTEQLRRQAEQYLREHLSEDNTEEQQKKIRQDALSALLPQAFALCREAAHRTIGLRHFDVQLIGGITLHEGKIAEMTTGEGKTLVATLPVYLNAILNNGVHVITVNDYLARRDCGWMGPVYHFLGLTCASIGHETSVQYDPAFSDESQRDDRMAHMRPVSRRHAYRCDITYGTNNEFGFDYLRDNMVGREQDMAQRQLHFAIVDEVDSILIDEARTPLIISGPAEASTDKYYLINKLSSKMDVGSRNEETKEETGDYVIDEKGNTVYLTEAGEAKASRLLNVPDLSSLETMELKHHVDQMLKAHALFKRDVHYVVKDGKVIIVDDFTGRLMPGRRWSDGLHQAVEAKEGLKIERENQTLATITFQNYFRMYEKLSGMTGTALTEEAEFKHIYKLEVLSIPTNRVLSRENLPDVIYKTAQEKFKAVVEEIAEMHQKGRPVLVGTISIENSELISQLLKRRGIPHNVLNAKYHQQEASIVAQAGRFGQVTIATNMAGRGTDILLGGNADFFAAELLRKKGIDPQVATAEQRAVALENVRAECRSEHDKVVELGGLHIIGTERHESRRIDNQLRGRCGRQGDPGSSRFYLSLEDDLMRIFASDRISRVMNMMQWEEDLPIEHPLITKSIEIAQKRVEAHNFEIRKQLLEYDNVMNRQREILYEQRKRVLTQTDLDPYVEDLIREAATEAVERYLPEKQHPADWDVNGLKELLHAKYGLSDELEPEGDVVEVLQEKLMAAYREKRHLLEPPVFQDFLRSLALHILDTQWKDHLREMDHLRSGIGLRAYGQKDPLVEYQHEGFRLFSVMIERIKDETLEFLFKIKTMRQEQPQPTVYAQGPVSYTHTEQEQFSGGSGPEIETVPQRAPTPPPAPAARSGEKVGRNDPCPCGSGKKHKKCCGK